MGKEKLTILHENTNVKSWFSLRNTNLKLYKSKQGGGVHIFYFCFGQGVWRTRKQRKKNKYQGGLVGAWNAFLLNVFNSMGYLRWWGTLFHAKEPEKEKLVLKISVLVLGNLFLFPWTRRRSEGITRSFRYCGALPWTTFCIKTHLLSNSLLSKGSSLKAQHFCL